MFTDREILVTLAGADAFIRLGGRIPAAVQSFSSSCRKTSKEPGGNSRRRECIINGDTITSKAGYKFFTQNGEVFYTWGTGGGKPTSNDSNRG